MTKKSLDIREDYKTKYGFRTKIKPIFETEKGLNERVVREISNIKNESDWLRQFRLRALNHFLKRPLPQWGGNLNTINFDDIVYYVKPTDQPQARSWEELPTEIKKTFDALGIPEAERKFLAGVGTQFESENVYHSLQKHLEQQGVIFVEPNTGLQQYPEIFRKYFGTVVPIEDNKFAALNSACFSGGSFIYIPPEVHVEMPLQAYFRINREGMGQFERTLIIADEGSKVHYIEGCTAAMTASGVDSLHTAVVELVALKGAQLRYTTLQNWSNNVFNLVTKRAVAHEGATVEWLDANIGCLTKDTKVFTDSDITKISKVRIGDIVYSLNQNLELARQKVVAKKVNNPSDVFRIITSNHEVKATANHPFLVLERFGSFNRIKWKRLGEIKIGDTIACADMLYGNKISFGNSLYFSRVISIENAGKRITYDIEVDGTANFIANGIFVHNSKLTMKYPSVYMVGPNAKADILSVAFAGKGQHQDAGGKAVHLAPNTTSKIISKSVSRDGGRSTYRGLLQIMKGAINSKSVIRCDALLADDISRTDTYPYNEVQEDTSTVTHEATVGKISEDLIFYLMSRGLNEQEALGLVVNGFFDIFTKELPMEYAIEFNRLIQLEMSGSVG